MDGLPDCRVHRHLLRHQQTADGVHGVLVAKGGEDQVLGVVSTPTRKCHFSPEWNVVFWRSACGEYATLITYYLSA